MKKHELLIEAMKRYPFGTKFLSIAHKEKCISNGIFYFGAIDKENILTEVDSIGRYVYIAGKWAEIITEEKPKSVLDGKVAIQVNNEREFKLLMEHYESKGWKSEYIEISAYPYYIDYKNKFDSSENTSAFTSRGEKIIPFQDFAKEVGIEVPKFVIKSEDGVDLYEGDDYHRAYKSPSCANWNYNGFWKGLGADCYGIQKPEEFKIFSTKQAALKWIEEQNKPKSKTLPLYFGQEAIINFHNSEVRIMDGGKEVSTLSFGDINDLYVEI